MNPKVAESVYTWRNRDQWNAVLHGSAHSTDQTTVIQTGRDAGEREKARGTGHIL